jgi:hypothetical protein
MNTQTYIHIHERGRTLYTLIKLTSVMGLHIINMIVVHCSGNYVAINIYISNIQRYNNNCLTCKHFPWEVNIKINCET